MWVTPPIWGYTPTCGLTIAQFMSSSGSEVCFCCFCGIAGSFARVCTMAPKRAAAKKGLARSRGARDVATDLAKLHDKEAMVEINRLLHEKPKQIMGCVAALKSDMFMPKERIDESSSWPSNFVRFDQVPKWWIVAWLDKSGPANLTKELLWTVDAVDLKCALRNLVEFFTGLKSTARLPGNCLIKRALKLTLDKHLEGIGLERRSGRHELSPSIQGGPKA